MTTRRLIEEWLPMARNRENPQQGRGALRMGVGRSQQEE